MGLAFKAPDVYALRQSIEGRVKAGVVVVFAFLWTNFAAAQSSTPVISFSSSLVSGLTPRTDGPLTLGTEIEVGSQAVTVTALGVQDGGLWSANSIEVGVWSADGSQLLRSAQVFNTAPVEAGGYRYVSISPLTLSANTRYLIGALGGGNALTQFAAFWDGVGLPNSPFSSASANITLIQSTYAAGSSLAAPTTPGTGTPAMRWAFANFKTAAAITATTRRLVVWGDPIATNSVMDSGVTQAVIASASVDTNVIAVLKNGGVTTWALNGSAQSVFNTPNTATSNVAMIAAGEQHFLALKNNGQLVAWGRGLSDSGTEPELGQGLVPADASSGVVAVAAGDYHSLALRGDGRVVAWGWDNYGQSTVPAQASNGVVAIAAGRYTSFALKSDGSLVGWGRGSYGATLPADATNDVAAVSAGRQHAMVLKKDGTVRAWGTDAVGQITTAIGSPVDLAEVTAVSAGRYYSMALKENRTAEAWGETGYTEDPFLVPADLANVVSIQGGRNHGLAIVSEGQAPQINLTTGAIQMAPGANTNLAVLVTGSGASFGSVGLPAGVTLAPSGILSVENTVQPTNVMVRLMAANSNGEDARVVRLEIAPSTNAAAIFSANFNDFTGTATGTQYQTGLPLVAFADVPGWGKFGVNSAHLVNRGAVTPDWAVMIFKDNEIISPAINANETDVEYRLSLDIAPAVYENPDQATRDNDFIVIKVYDAGFQEVGSFQYQPRAWQNPPVFRTQTFTYVGNGNGPVLLYILSTNQVEEQEFFAGAVDNITITAAGAGKATPTLSTAPIASTITYGDPLSASTLAGGAASVPGTFAFKNPATTPGAGNAQNFPVVFTPTDTANYETLEINVAVTVNPAALPSVTFLPPDNLVYDKTGKIHTASASGVSGFSYEYRGRNSTIYAPTAEAPINAGDYTVKATSTDPNFAGFAEQNFTITLATATVTLGNLSPTYNGSPKPVTVNISPVGVLFNVQYNGGSAVPTNAGDYPVLVTVTDPNYSGSKSDTLVIAKADPVINTPPTISAITYGQTLGSVTFTGGAFSPTGTFAFVNPSVKPSAGVSQEFSVQFTPTDTANYNTGTRQIAVTVNPAPLTITGISIANKPYDGTKAATITGTASYAGLVNGETFAVTGTPSAVFDTADVGNGKAVEVNGYTAPSANYTVSQPIGLTATITAAAITNGNIPLSGTTEFIAHSTSYTSTGTLQFSLQLPVEYLVVAGGGAGGGRDVAGGGGAGGVLDNVGGTPLLITGNTNLAVTVGAGGTGVSDAAGNNGGNSVLGSITALGGGGGSYYNQTSKSGGSGGGSGRGDSPGSPTGGAGTAGQGNAGGNGFLASSPGGAGGGGGGAGQAGSAATSWDAGKGGDGRIVTIAGSGIYYGGGGGGSAHRFGTANNSGAGGQGGGGAGAINENSTPTAGQANTGGGGGASRNAPSSGLSGATSGANGGSGVVVARYPGGALGTGGTISNLSVGGTNYTLHRFTNAGSATLALTNLSAMGVRLTGGISGSGGIQHQGPGTLTLASASTYSGSTVIDAGATLQLDDGGTVGAGNVTNNGTLVFNPSSTLLFSNLILGTGQVIQEGTGTTVLTASNSYVGGTTINKGRLVLSNSSTQFASPVTINLNGIFEIFTSTNATLAAGVAISGAGGLEKNGAGTLEVNSILNQTGGTFVQGGVLRLDAGSTAAGNFPAQATYTIGNGATLQVSAINNVGFRQYWLNGSSQLRFTTDGGGTIDNPGANFVLNGTPTVVSAGGAQNRITGSSGLNTHLSSALTFDVNRGTDVDGDLVVSIPVNNGGSVTKTGNGILVLEATNTYTGTTTVNQGTLRVAVTGRINGGTVTVNSGAQVEGSGTINSLSIASGGILKITAVSTNTTGAWNTGGTITFASGSKVEVSGLTQQPYVLVRGTSVTGTPMLQGATGFTVANTNNSITLTPTLDTDGDGLSDYEESQIGTNPNLADSDGDGLADGQEVNTYGSNPLLTDSDGDGAGDKLEADLGNSLTAVNVYNRLINGSFEDGTVKPGPGESLAVHQDNVPGWKTTANNNFNIKLWYSGFEGSSGNDGNTLAELNYIASGMLLLYQDVVMTLDSAVSYSFLHRARDGTESIEFRIDRLVGGPGSAVDANFFTRTVSTGTSWVRYTGAPPGTVQAGKTYRFSYSSVLPATGGAGNLLDAASFETDQDNDGLGDTVETETGTFVSLENTGTSPHDSDSDNDGIPDGTEALTYGTNPTKADSDGDGVEDAAELAAGTDPLKASDRPVLLSAGWNHTLYLPTPGQHVLAWGLNEDGRCGLGHTTSPVVNGEKGRYRDLEGGTNILSNLIAVSAGGSHSLVLRSVGGVNRVWAAGANSVGQLGQPVATLSSSAFFREVPGGVPSQPVAIAAGSRHSLTLGSDGRVYAWGDNSQGQLGLGTTAALRDTPAPVPGLINVKAIAVGADHSVALTTDGKVYAWGRGNSGQLGYYTLTGTNAPRQITGIPTAVQIAAGDKHTLIRTEAGEVYVCGANTVGQAGLPAANNLVRTPTKLSFPGGAATVIRKLVAGLNRAHAIATHGKVYAWGYNYYGELGLGYATTTPPYGVFGPTEVPALFGVKEIASGGFQTFALDESGTLAGTGLNNGGQLGTGGTDNVTGDPAVATESGKLPQEISFTLPGTSFFTDTSIPLTVTVDSGLVPNLVSSDPTVVSIDAGRALFLKAGSARITATQPGNSTFNAAQPVYHDITVTNPPPLTLQLAGATGSLLVPAAGTNTVPVDDGLQILGRAETTLTAATVKIVAGRQTGDTLAFAGYTGPLTATYNADRGTLRISGVTNLAGYQEALRKVVLATTNRAVVNRTITMALGSGIAFTNGHVYEFVNSLADWPTARSAAKNRRINGQDGYLANVTTAQENAFLLELLQEGGANGWLGGADITDANFRWMDGPEAGAQFWTGNSGGSSFGSAYANWGVGEPNDYAWPTPTISNWFAKSYESYVMMVRSSSFVIGGITRSTAPGKWNDAPLKTSATSSYRLGYLVEYGSGEPLLFAKTKTLQAMALTWRANGEGVAITGYTGSGSEVIIPATLDGLTVNRIDPEAFKDQSTITQITIPAGVTSIGYYAFANCTRLEAIFFEGDAPTLEFGSGDPFVFVPAEAVVYYRSTRLGWGSSFGGRTTAPYTSPGSSPGRWDFQTGNYAHNPADGMLILELGGLEGTTLYDQIFVREGTATLDGIVNLMFYNTYSGPLSGSWHTFDLIWAKHGIVFGDDYQIRFQEPGYRVETAVVERDGGQLWQATVRQAGTPEEIAGAAVLAQPILGIGTSPGPEGAVEMMYTYHRLAGGSVLGGRYVAAGLQYEVQMSSNLIHWNPVPVEEVEAVPAAEGYELATVRVISNTPRAFLRLKVSD